jgi:hypothetical protein
MYCIARLSGGLASAVATDRAIQRYGRKRVWIRFENTLWEDEDTHRFIADCMKRWGGQLIVGCVGKTPLDVFEAKQIIPNSAIAPCSAELKIKPFAEWLWRVPKPTTILSGLGWQEPHRITRLLRYHKHAGKWRAPMGFGRTIPGVYEDFPLLWKPLEYRPYADVVRSWGIEPPRAYALGFPHNNCGGRCVRQGVSEWRRLWQVWPERFAEMRDWEASQRAKGGARARSAFSRQRVDGIENNVSLADLERDWGSKSCQTPMLPMFGVDDRGACFCTDEWHDNASPAGDDATNPTK